VQISLLPDTRRGFDFIDAGFHRPKADRDRADFHVGADAHRDMPRVVGVPDQEPLLLVFEQAGGRLQLRLDYDLTWSSVSGGAARMTIAPIDANRLRITSVAKSGTFFSRFFKVRDEIESIVGSDDFSTLQYHKMLQEGSKRKDELTVVDERHHVAIRKGKSVPVPDPVFDPISLMYYVRGLDLTPGRTHEFTIVADGKVYKVAAVVRDRETIGTPAGTSIWLIE